MGDVFCVRDPGSRRPPHPMALTLVSTATTRTGAHSGGSPVGVALDTATMAPPTLHHCLLLALGDIGNTLVSRTASATQSLPVVE